MWTKSQVEEGGEIEREDIIVEENNVETPDSEVSEKDEGNLDEPTHSIALDSEKEEITSNKSVNREDKVEKKEADSSTSSSENQEPISSEIEEKKAILVLP